MKTISKRFLKGGLALLLAFVMLFGTTITGFAAVVDNADTKANIDVADTDANVDVAETSATTRYIYVGISNNYQTYKNGSEYGFNFWGGSNGGVKSGTYVAEYNWDGRKYYMYRVSVSDDNNKAQFKGNNNWWDPGDGFSVTLNGTTNNAVFFSHQNDGWQGQFQQNYQETSTGKLSASSTSVSTNTAVTLTPSLSSNATYNEVKSTTYKIDKTSGASISGNTFTATAAGTYTVTATITYNPKYFTGITKTATATTTITVSDPTYSYTVTAGNGGTITSTPTNGTAASVTVTAEPDTGYEFAGWETTKGSVTDPSSLSTTFKPSANGANANATFKKLEYALNISETGATGGTFTVDGVAFTSGSNVTHDTHTLGVTAPTGYKVKTINGGTANPATINVTGATTINVVYELDGTCSPVFVDTSKMNLVLGEEKTRTASLNDFSTDDCSVTYSSSDTTVATVNATTGKVKALKAGTTTITATCPEHNSTASYDVEVLAPSISVADVTVAVNGTATVAPTFTENEPAAGSYTLSYSGADASNDDNYAIDTSTGKITGQKPGTSIKASVDVMYNGKSVASKTFNVTVSEPTVSLNKTTLKLLTGQTAKLSVTSTPDYKSVAWTPASVVTVATDGTVSTTATIGTGNVTATVKYNEFYSKDLTCAVTVASPELTLSTSDTLNLEVGGGTTTGTITVTNNDSDDGKDGTDAVAPALGVTSSNPDVATAKIVDGEIKVEAKAVGTTELTISYRDVTEVVSVTVTQYDPFAYIYVTDSFNWGTMYIYGWNGSSDVVIPKETPMIYIGRNDQDQRIFAYRILKTDLPEKAIFKKGTDWGYQSTDTVLTDATVQAYYFNSNTWAMMPWNIDLVRPTVSVADVVVPVGGTETATATVTNGDKVLWKSQDSGIATVADVDTQTSTVTGVTPGDTTISARAFVDTANSSIKTLPTNYNTDSTCWPFISTEATATVTVGSVDYNTTASTSYSNNGTDYASGTTGGTVSIIVDDENKGTSAAVAHGKDYTLTANAAIGYRFVGWYIGDTQVSPEASYTVNAKAAADYTAKFVKTYKVSVLLGNGIDSIEYNGVSNTEDLENITVDAGATITVYASPAVNYNFKDWTVEGTTVADNTVVTLTINVQSNIKLTANAVPTYTATATAQTNKYFGTYGGTVTIDGQSSPVQYLAGETVTFEAHNNTNYYFDGWYSDAEFTNKVSSAAEYQATMTEDGITLYGLFVKKFFITKSDDSNLAEFVYDIATNTYTVTADFTDHLTITSVDCNDVEAADVNVTGGTHTGCTVAGHYTSYQVTPDTENYDITAPVTYTLTPDMNSQDAPDGTYTMNITLQAAEKVEIRVNGTKVADKAIGSTFSYEIDAPDGQYLSGATTTPSVDLTIDGDTITFTVPNSNVNIVPSFADYSYVELSDSTGISATGLKTGYKAGEAVSITLSPASEATTITNVVADYNGAVITQNGDNWTVTIASMPADTTITLTPTVDAKFVMNYGTQVAIGNYGTGVTSGFGTVSMSIGGTALANGGYAAPTDTVTYTATESNANYTFAGFYSDEECEDVLSYELTYEVKPTKDTTVYTLWARRQYMDFDWGSTNIVKELVYDKQERVYTLSTVLADDSSANAISKGAWFQVTNDTNDWTSDPTSYHHFGSDFSVSHNAKGFDATISWNDGGDSWKLSTSAANDTAIKFILTPTGNTAIDFSAQVGEVGDFVYLSSGHNDLGNATTTITTPGLTATDKVSKHSDGTVIENYKAINLSEPQTISWETEIGGENPEYVTIDKYIVYKIQTGEWEIITPVNLGNNKYSGSVYVEGECYILPVYFNTEAYGEATGRVPVDVYFDLSEISNTNWGPFVACYAYSANQKEYQGTWPGQMMIPTADGKSFYSEIYVDPATATDPAAGFLFSNYLEFSCPVAESGVFGTGTTKFQTYDYREAITLYEQGYEVITFVAKNSSDGYHGGTKIEEVSDIFSTYNFDYLYSRNDVPMDMCGNEIENPVDLSSGAKADYYIVSKGNVDYNKEGYAPDSNYNGDWSVEWYVFDSTGEFLGKDLSTSFYFGKEDPDDEDLTVLMDKIGVTSSEVAGKTVAISYEAENGSRFDGQWYGSMLDHSVTGQVKVGFKNGEIFEIDDDETPNEAYYGNGYLVDENGEPHQTLEVSLEIGSVDLHAERQDGYAFVGWYTMNADGSYARLSTAFDYNTYINLNETYYAIFRELGEGEVIINHSTYNNPNDPAIPSHGGVAEMSIVVTDTTANQIFNCTPSTSRASVTFPGIEDHTYTVTITTTPLMNGEFFAWYTDSFNADGTKTYEEVFTREDVFNSTSTVTATFEYTYTPGSQKIINIYSDVKRVTNSATLVYKYYNRFGELRTYTVYDVPLTDEECLGFVGNGGKQYVPAYITAYTMSKADGEAVVYGEERRKEYLDNGYTQVGSYNKVSAYAPKSEVTEVFDGTVQWIISDTTLTTESSLVTLVADQGTPDYVINYTIGAESGSKTGKYNELINITAPTTLNGQEFSYWYEPATGEILTYSVFYNYRIVEDKRIEAVYGQTNLPEWVPSINSIVTTREFADGGDYIYTDHLLAFNNKQGLVLKAVQSAKGIEYGLMVLRDADEYIDDLNEANNAKYADNTDKNWNTIVERLKTIASVRRKNSAFTIDGNKYNCYFYNLSQSQMTNFNRLDYYIKYDNEKLVDETHYYREYALTAVAYIIVDGTVYLSNPKNTNFYELGNKEVTDSTN